MWNHLYWLTTPPQLCGGPRRYAVGETSKPASGQGRPPIGGIVRDWDSAFNTWWRPVSDTEAEKCERAERMIREAIGASDTLKQHQITVFAQGSYRNETNVRQDSDVDICVCCTDTFITDYTHAPGLTDAILNYHDGTYTQAQFKDDTGAALVAKFGNAGVARGNKAFDVHETTARVDADVVPAFEFRLFYPDGRGGHYFEPGTSIRPDVGSHIINFPQQHYDKGCAKNVATGYTFKRVVRIVKRLWNEMAENNVEAAKPIPSYLIECLIWNVPNGFLATDTYYSDVRGSLAYLYNQLTTAGATDEWLEVSGLKYIFRSGQPWTREQATAFVLAAWHYVGFT